MFSFTKNRRLLKKTDFDFVFAEAKTIKTRDFVMLYRPNMIGYPRIGFAFSKKKIAKAHDRNRMKRLVRESFRVNQISAVDIIFLAQKSAAFASNASITAGLIELWKKISVTD